MVPRKENDNFQSIRRQLKRDSVDPIVWSIKSCDLVECMHFVPCYNIPNWTNITAVITE